MSVSVCVGTCVSEYVCLSVSVCVCVCESMCVYVEHEGYLTCL